MSPIVVTVDSRYITIDGQLQIMSIFEPVFSPVHATAQAKNAPVGLADFLKTANREDKLIKGT